jgi:hypothetical protein
MCIRPRLLDADLITMGVLTTPSSKEKATSKDDDNTASAAKKYDVTIQEHQIGVFRLLIAVENTSHGLAQYWKNLVPTTSLTTCYRLTSDIFQIAPVLVVLYALSSAWTGMHEAVEMTITNRVLELVSFDRLLVINDLELISCS